jgi:2',3'-cyclic-nucleotide 2'-phosphodiesterase (5'-nucleotidase family)
MKYFSFFLIFTFLACGRTYHVADIQHRSNRIDKASYPVDVEMANMIEPYKLKLEETMNEVIGYNEEEMTKGKPQSSLTNWFADALLDEAQKLVADSLDFAIQNYGGIRIPVFPKGKITVSRIYELMPFDNIMFILELKGDTVQMLFDKMAESGGWPVSRNVYFEIAYSKAKNIKIKGAPLDTNKMYKVAIPDYVAQGGDKTDFLKDAISYNTGALIRDMLINHVRESNAKGINIKADLSPRIIE